MKYIYLLFTLIFFTAAINAQEHRKGKGKEKIRAIKIAYLTEKLDLTANESEKFWPLFNEFHKKRKALYSFEKKQLKQKAQEGYNIDDITEKEASETLKKIFEYREERYQNKKAFRESLLKILPAKKILVLEITEKEFNKKLMHKLKNKPEK